MSPREPSNPLVGRLVAAINDGDREGFLAALSPDATLAREAVARHERVVFVNHERPTLVIMHPDDTAAAPASARRGRPLREALGLLAEAALPDPGFADDMKAVLADTGPVPDDRWARS